MPSHDEVQRTLENAKAAAIEDGLLLGMRPDNLDGYQFNSKIDVEAVCNDCDDIVIEDDQHESDEEIDNDNADENSALTTIIDDNGRELLIRKSTLVWMLSERGAAISKDRLRRVQVSKQN